MNMIEACYVRRAVPENAAQLAELADKSFSGYPFEEIYREVELAVGIEQGEHRVIAVDPDSQILATAVLGIEKISPMAEIKRVMVDPDWRRNGLATRMTIALAQEADRQGKFPWADVRAHQIGMQKAAVAAGLRPISLERGKHAVFNHYLEDRDIGAARETMIHMTSLQLDERSLLQTIGSWPSNLINLLTRNMRMAHSDISIDTIDSKVARERLSSAAEVSNSIQAKLEILQETTSVEMVEIDSNLALVRAGQSEVLIIKPDASGFISPPIDGDLTGLLPYLENLDLQILTCYIDASAVTGCSSLLAFGFEPTMVRPWQETETEEASWQVGFTKTMNQYGECLHSISLVPEIQQELFRIIDEIERLA